MSKQSFNVERSLRLKPIDLTTLTSPKNGELAIDVNDSNKLKKYNEIVSAWEDTSPVEVTNYILNPNAQNNTFGWATYANTPGAAPISGTGGSPTVTLTRSTSAPLRGNASFLYTKPSSNVQGQGFSYDFTIDSADTGKVLQGSFDYQIASGTFADNDMSVWIYDITNGRMIQPAPYLLKNSGLIERFPLEFQTAINSTSYRLIIHQAGTSAAANTIKLDNFFVGPSAKLYGSAVTDPTSYVPSISPNTNATPTAFYSRSGKYLVVEGRVSWTGTGSASSIVFSLPAGLSIDTSAIPTLGTSSFLGKGSGAQQSVRSVEVIVAYETLTSVRILGGVTGSAAVNKLSFDGALFESAPAAGSYINIRFSVPILGWSSSQVMSNDASTRVVAASADGKLATGTLGAAYNLSKIPTVDLDTNGAYNPATGEYTIPVAGNYQVRAYFEYGHGAGSDAASVSCAIYNNGVATGVYGSNYVARTTIGNISVSCETIKPFKAGDRISFYSYSSTATPTYSATLTGTGFSISRISGPSQIMASESVNLFYYNVAGTALAAITTTLIPYPTKVFDSHNSYNPSTGIFTAPISGKYLVNANLITTPVIFSTSNQGINLFIRKNGTDLLSTYTLGNGSSNSYPVRNSGLVDLLAGETITIYSSVSTACSLNTSSVGYNTLSIARIGN